LCSTRYQVSLSSQSELFPFIHKRLLLLISVIDTETGKCLGDLNEVGNSCLAAGGGSGGCAGNSFIGKRGHRRLIKLDLKLIADVGLVGFPNAGKSTFLNAISNASPKIAAYPFTTIKPQIGIIDYADHRQVSVADLPGLIEGAHRNIGMGHKFLKHVERTRMLLLIVDVFGFQLSPNHKKRNMLENIFSLNKELELYDPSLLSKNCVLLINKMDVPGSDAELLKYQDALDNLDKVVHHCSAEIKPEQLLKFERILTISAKRGDSVEQAKLEIRNVLDIEAEQNLEPPDVEALARNLAERSSRLV
jgi:Obg family GTPase CgtA